MDFQKVADAVENSRPEIKDLLFSEEIGQSLQNIAENNKLNEETSLKMIDEVGYIILGLKERSSIKNSLADIGVEKTAIPSIIQEVSKEIFSKLDKIEPTNSQPVIITTETKEAALKDLNKRVEQQKVTGPETLPTNLPMVEPAFAQGSVMVKKGEVAHDVPHVEQPKAPPVQAPKTATAPDKPMPTADARYPGGKDPYREPLA